MANILIVDDETSLCSILSIFLIQEKFEVITSDSAEAALVLIRQKKPDIILCDVNLPDMNGRTFVDTLHASDDTSYIPVIMTTGDNTINIQTLNLEGKVAAVVYKPFDAFELLDIIRSLLKS